LAIFSIALDDQGKSASIGLLNDHLSRACDHPVSENALLAGFVQDSYLLKDKKHQLF
jgi:hypothetical protein